MPVKKLVPGLLFGAVLLALSPWIVLFRVNRGEFFEVRFVEIVGLLMTALLAIGATFVLGSRLGREDKRRELVSATYDRLIVRLEGVYDIGYSYVTALPEKRQKRKERRIKAGLQEASILVSQLAEICKRDDYDADWDSRISAVFLRFKARLTDTPFGAKEGVYGTDRISEIEAAYERLSGLVHNAKLRTYF